MPYNYNFSNIISGSKTNVGLPVTITLPSGLAANSVIPINLNFCDCESSNNCCCTLNNTCNIYSIVLTRVASEPAGVEGGGPIIANLVLNVPTLTSTCKCVRS